jgi:hypothetical protein
LNHATFLSGTKETISQEIEKIDRIPARDNNFYERLQEIVRLCEEHLIGATFKK